MKPFRIITGKPIQELIDSYPPKAAQRLYELRQLIIETAKESPWVEELEETLKWGEPSYLSKQGSTIRMDWKAKQPNQFALYFKCTSRLVPSFREIFPEHFQFEGNRAIIFGLDDEIPKNELKQCIGVALTYHQVKGKPLLGLLAD